MLKKDLDVEGLYSAVEAIPKDVRFLAGLTNLVWVQANEYLEPTVEDTCLSINPPPPNSKRKSTRYDASYFEYLMWMTSLASMSWLLTNVKKKSEHGQCHNPIHKETQEKTGYT